ncbi:MAG: membrane protein insertase YidC [Alphaproteobacteria bacterium]|nr:membrane protein insertase YidC [Alphaproteobacteria bacterium]
MDQKNLIAAIALSVAILVAFHWLMPPSRPAPPPSAVGEASTPDAPAISSAPPTPAGGPAAPGTQPVARDRTAVISGTPRVAIDTPSLKGSIAKAGGVFDDLTLVHYGASTTADSPKVNLLSPTGSKDAYVAKFGWVGEAGVAVPGEETVWTTDRDTLDPDRPVTFTWDNGGGLIFSRTVVVDRDYLFTVTQRVKNTGGRAVNLYPYGLIARSGEPETSGYYILHEGGLGVFDGVLSEESYSNIKSKGQIEKKAVKGWIGITDKYWLTALIPDQSRQVTASYRHAAASPYQVDYLHAAMTLAPGETIEMTDRLFAGAKVVRVIDGYEERLAINGFDKAIDWGWFFFLTKPMFLALRFFSEYFGNFGLAILALTVCVKLAFFPLANKSYRAMSKMKLLAPEIKKLQARFKDDRARMQQEMMALYKREKANPLSGCLPIVVQIPVFFSLYKVLFVTIEMRQAPFYGWINDLSVPDPYNLFTLFGVIPWMPPAFIPVIGIWPLIMGVSMFLQQKLNPQPADPVQAKIFMLMPIFFTFLLAGFPAGLVIYWTWNNVLSIGQQWIIMRQAGVKNPIAD